jgi:hypothetical protein
VLLGGVPGVAPAGVVILGGGVVGTNAASMALGMGADVVIIEKSVERMEELVGRFGTSLKTIYSTAGAIEEYCIGADLVIGGILIPGHAAPKLITRDIVRGMRPGSVIVDVAIDQGGCAETSRPTTFDNPTYAVDGVIHYCVANMPGGVARTSTYALNNVTLPFGLAIADKGYKQALLDNPHLRNGLNVIDGKVTLPAGGGGPGIPVLRADDAVCRLRGAFGRRSVIARVMADLAAEHPIGPDGVAEDHRQQKDRAGEQEGEAGTGAAASWMVTARGTIPRPELMPEPGIAQQKQGKCRQNGWRWAPARGRGTGRWRPRSTPAAAPVRARRCWAS